MLNILKNEKIIDFINSHPIKLYIDHYANIIAYINKKKNRNIDFFYSRIPKNFQFVFNNRYSQYIFGNWQLSLNQYYLLSL